MKAQRFILNIRNFEIRGPNDISCFKNYCILLIYTYILEAMVYRFLA